MTDRYYFVVLIDRWRGCYRSKLWSVRNQNREYRDAKYRNHSLLCGAGDGRFVLYQVQLISPRTPCTLVISQVNAWRSTPSPSSPNDNSLRMILNRRHPRTSTIVLPLPLLPRPPPCADTLRVKIIALISEARRGTTYNSSRANLREYTSFPQGRNPRSMDRGNNPDSCTTIRLATICNLPTTPPKTRSVGRALHFRTLVVLVT